MSIGSTRIKIQRAKEHIIDLESEIKSFLANDPYIIGAKRNPQTRQLTYYLVSVQDVLERIAAVAGDAIQNLRSALDHLAYALFMAGPGGKSGSPCRHVYFPISDDAMKYAAESIGKVKGMRHDAIDADQRYQTIQGWERHAVATPQA